jgi:Kef-type K+ transport system membrane component KefB
MISDPINILASLNFEMNIALLFGLIIIGGTLGSRLIQRIHFPQVVGCILVGILLGDVLGVINYEMIEALEPFTMFALGIIGFLIGAELRSDVFKKYGKQFFIILFSQGIATFVLVAAGTSVIVLFITADIKSAVAAGLVLGAIGSATAPAATVNVLWEYKTRGPLTAAILAIVALDDALALVLYRAAATSAKALMGTGHRSIIGATSALIGEIAGAIILGVAAGFALYYLLKLVRAEDKILEFSLSALLLVVGISIIPGIDPILPAMTLGITMANLAPRESKKVFELIGKFSPPVYICFFVLAGAHMEFGKIGILVIILITAFVLFRVSGKVVGSWLGAVISKAPKTVRQYLGICLLPQAGVAIGLAILSGKQFPDEIGRTIIMVVMTATFIMEIVGPVLVKVGVKKAGEVGMNVTEEDLIKSYNIEDVMDTDPPMLTRDTPLQQILDTFSSTDSVLFPVVDRDSKIVGKITIAGIKQMFANQDVVPWLLALDVAEPLSEEIYPDSSLEETLEFMERYDIECIPVVKSTEDKTLLGLLTRRTVNRKIGTEVLRRRQTADGLSTI